MKQMPDLNEQHELLLTAYLDGELSSDERAEAEALLKSNPEYQELVDQWRENGSAIRSLPKFNLDDEFANRVMRSSEFVKAAQGQQIVSTSSVNSVSDQSLSPESHWKGMAAIASLAALLLLTLFVFPKFVDDSVAKLDSAPDNVTQKKQDEPKETTDQLPEQATIQRVPRNKRLANGANSGGVVAVPSTQQPAVEQVLIVKVDSTGLADVQQVLQKNAIKIVEGEVEPTSEVEAIYLVSTPSRMRQVINQLASELSAKVTTFPLPMSVVKSGNSTRLKPLKFEQDSQQQEEIAKLDRWFGLSGEGDDDKETRFLLLVEQ